MANIPLSRSEVFGELRKELHDDKEFHESDAHVFIIMGASVRPVLVKCENRDWYCCIFAKEKNVTHARQSMHTRNTREL